MIEIFVKKKKEQKRTKNIRGRKKAQNITTFEHD